MFLSRLESSDPRFKSIGFQDGLNIVLAEKADNAEQGDSRNSTGKSSLIAVLRYILGGRPGAKLTSAMLSEHSFTASLNLSFGGQSEPVNVRRPIAPQSVVQVSGWGAHSGNPEISVDEWRALQSRFLFGIPDGTSRPTSSQLWAQLIRSDFNDPTKTYRQEPDWESGVRLGFLLGLEPGILNKSNELARLNGQRKAVKSVEKEQALAGFSLDEAAIRSELASARSRRDEVRASLDSFKVDDQYAEHQRKADSLSQDIQALNDQILVQSRRANELAIASKTEVPDADLALGQHVSRLYEEMGVQLPDLVKKRYAEVTTFHASVVSNRKHYLAAELAAVNAAVATAAAQRDRIDSERAVAMQLLASSVAMETFVEATRSLAQLEADVVNLERQLENASNVNKIDNTIKLKKAETIESLSAEIAERALNLDHPISMFRQLGNEIYSDRKANLLVSVSSKGNLKVDPEISGDGSDGIQGVETFLLDIVCLIQGIETGRAPRFLAHDSHLFDATDDRQIASCLNIAARLAESHGFQYVVTMNSDRLASVESEGAFDSAPYVLDTKLSDETEEGGLFGFRY